MAKRMLIDAAHPEETRVVVLSGHRLEEFDFETSTKKQIKGNIYLAKVTRVEPSLQAAFVEYGGNRHGFLAFSEIHPDYYRIPVADRLAALDADRAAEVAANEEEDEATEGAAEASGIAPFAKETSSHSDFAVEGADHPDDEPPSREAMAEPMQDDRLFGPSTDAYFEEPTTEPSESTEPAIGAEPPASFAADDSARPADSDETGIGETGIGETGAGESEFDDAGESVGPVESSSETAGAERPAGDAFAEDDTVRSGDIEASEDAAEHAAFAEHHDHREMPEPNRAIETIGGDEIEETTRPRMRPLRHYKIQEVIKRRQIMLVQVVKEERGNKGAALTTYISLAGRYCVLMPNTPRGGGVSRKITSMQDRRRLKDLVSDLDVPDGMGVIVRTAGSERSKAEIKRDFEYLLRLWDEIRELTLKSTAPALIYEEGNLIKRSIRDLYSRDIDEVLVDGRDGYETAKSFMRMLMPSHAKRVKLYNDPTVPLFHRFQVEGQLDAIHSPVVQLRSGGYIVINPTEALVAIDVNSGRSTRERNIEETALKTNLEAAEEVARQLRLRDLAGLIVIDFIDMEEHRHNGAVERRMKDAMRHDRARIQIGHISPFGLLELSRQRLRPSLLETSTQPCPHCNGTGHIRSTESTALLVLRAIEEEGMRRRTAEVKLSVTPAVALYVLNQKRTTLAQIETRYGCHVMIDEDETLIPPAFRLERARAFTPAELAALPQPQPIPVPVEEEPEADEAIDGPSIEAEEEAIAEPIAALPEGGAQPSSWLPSLSSDEEGEEEEPGTAMAEDQGHGDGHGRRRRRRRRRRGGERSRGDGAAAETVTEEAPAAALEAAEETVREDEETDISEQTFGEGESAEQQPSPELQSGNDGERKRRRRGRRGGRRRNHGRGIDDRSHDSRPGLQLELRPGEPGYSGPAEEFGDADGDDSSGIEEHEEASESEANRYAEHIVQREDEPHENEPHGAEPLLPRPAPVASAPISIRSDSAEVAPTHRGEEDAGQKAAAEAEPERTPVAYNVPPAHDVTGPPPNPRRGWWRR